MNNTNDRTIENTTLEEMELAEKQSWLAGKVKDYFQLSKFRLSFTVVFSAVAGFLLASSSSPDLSKLFLFTLGGLLVTCASNGFNQVIEKETDKLMERTKNRPLPANRMKPNEALIASFTMAISGVAILTISQNILCGLLSLISICLYTLAYTPMKRISPIAVFIGAIPGALPPLIGWVAVSGEITFGALLVFFIQFIWQFPHFWAIAWVSDADYSRAGFHLLPSSGGKNRMSAFQIVAYSLGLIPIGFLPYFFGMTGSVSAAVICICGILFTWLSVRLLRSSSDAHARQLMFASFIYLPIVLIAMMADKL